MSSVSVNLMGGLGNMLFQITAAYSTSLRDNKDFFCNELMTVKPHNHYNVYLNSIFRKIQFKKTENDIIKYNEPHFHYSEIPKIVEDFELVGYFQSEKYFNTYKKEILDLFEIDSDTKRNIDDKYGDLFKENNTCSIHVRRGDYVNLQNSHPLQSIDYYKNAVDIIGNDKHYLIFSDDINWCIENFDFIKNKTFISGNSDFFDLYLMSMCNNNIIANSTFSWWAAWLDINKDKKVICPKIWFGINYSHFDTSDIYCIDWIKL